MGRSNATMFPAGRRLLAALLCLNLAVMPCSVLAAGDLPCGNCPPDAGTTGPAVHAHGAANMEHAGHDQAPETTTDCLRVAPDCCDLDATTADDRPYKPAKPPAVDAAVAVPAMHEAPAVAPASILYGTGPPGAVTAHRRLHVIYCVYRD